MCSYIYDTNHTVCPFFSYSFFSCSSRLVFIIHINSLYTVVPHNMDHRALRHFLNTSTPTPLYPIISALFRIADLTLTQNCFSVVSARWEGIIRCGGILVGPKILRRHCFVSDCNTRLRVNSLPVHVCVCV